MLNPGGQIPAGYSGKFHDPNVGTMGNFRGSNGFGFEKPALRISGSYDNYRKSSGIEFGGPTQFEDDSGISSPPLWKMSPPGNPTTKAFRLQQQQQQQHLTTSSRSQAIADGRRELMEMIQGVPEAAYELSLKDLVELPTNRGTRKVALQGETDLTEEVIYEEKKTTTMTKTSRSNRHVVKHGNTHRGAFLLNMFFPISLGSKKRSSGASTCSKVSPKPLVGEAEKSGFEKGVDREWWKKQNSAGGDSESSGRSKSSGGSMSSSSSSGRQMSGVAPGCWFFFHTNNSKTKGHKR